MKQVVTACHGCLVWGGHVNLSPADDILIAVERPLSEIRELNPGLLKLVAPAGYALHVPKGTVATVEAAFSVVPPNRRDA